MVSVIFGLSNVRRRLTIGAIQVGSTKHISLTAQRSSKTSTNSRLALNESGRVALRDCRSGNDGEKSGEANGDLHDCGWFLVKAGLTR
jgi:hypothetical protein